MKRDKRRKRSSHSKYLSAIDEFKKSLFDGKQVNPRRVFGNVQASGDYGRMRIAAEYVDKQSHLFHQFVYGTPFARTYAETWLAKRLFGFTASLQSNLDWMSLSIVRYSRELTAFLNEAASFRKAFVLGSYEEASRVLDTIVAGFGYSLWVLEKSFLLAEYAHGLESNKQLLTQIIEDDSNHRLLAFLAQFLSLRCETKLSNENYRIRLDRALDADEEYPLAHYVRYRLDDARMDVSSVAPLITYYEGPTPIIDRYLTFIAILQCCAVAGDKYSEVAKNALSRIAGFVDDPRVNGLLHFFNPEREQAWNMLASQLINILDDYTCGNYQESAIESAKVLIDNPEVWELYYIYVRSLDHLGKPFDQFFPEHSTAASILEHVNLVIRTGKSHSTSLDYISKISTSLWRDPLAYGLLNFYEEETLGSPNDHAYRLMLLNSACSNPSFAGIYGNPEKANAFLKQLSSRAGQGITVKLMRAITALSVTGDSLELPEAIPETRRRIYTAEIHRMAGRSQQAISVLQPLLTRMLAGDMPEGIYSCDRIVKVLFRIHLETGDLGGCTDLVVRLFLRNERLIRKLPLVELTNAIDEALPTEVIQKITYPILYSMAATKPRAVYVPYDNFLSNVGITRPTQLMSIADQFDPRELREFLFRVCAIDVLACSYHFQGTRDLEAERIRICQFLSEIDPARSKTYSDEISTITSRSLIKEGMRQIEGSKIYVDEKGIRATGRKLLEESFSRYRELASMSSIDTIRMLDPENLHLYIITPEGLERRPISASDLDLAGSQTRIVPSSLFLTFIELFMDIRDRFIASGDYGLDGYLSVRVRHGVLQNQVRSPFEALHLISEKDTTTGEYLSNPFWDDRLEDCSPEGLELIQKSLATFSREVDDLALELNKDMIQVRTEKKNANGLFNYAFESAELFQMFENEFINIDDFEQFMDGIFRVLWKRTEENLASIREVISSELKNRVYERIGQLDREIRTNVAPFQAAELLHNIASCQTRVQNTLESVAQWFTISGSSLIPEFGLNELINICVESINNIYPHKKISPAVKTSENLRIDGSFFTPFFDIMRTLLDNVIIHSSLPPEDMDVQIAVEVTDSHLTIRIKNRLEEQVRQADPVKVLKLSHSTVKTSDIIKVIASEGRSGLIKVRKIMIIDLQRKDSSIDFSYDEDSFVVMIRMEREGLGK